MEQMKQAQDLIDFTYNSPTAYHAVINTAEVLEAKGYKKLCKGEKWDIAPKGKYYVTAGGTSLLAFNTGDGDVKKGFRIIAAHNDSPTFKIKPIHEMKAEKAYIKLNTEVYGGPILSTWFDRPLAVAGKVTLKSENIFAPEERIINIHKPITIIQNMAIHMNREVNNGYNFNPQKDTLPLLCLINEELEESDFLLKAIAAELKTESENIIDFELFLYEYEKGCIMGLNDEFISTNRLDDLWMVHAGLNAFVDSSDISEIKVLLTTDHEEVGSASAYGADSAFILNTLKRIAIGLGASEEELYMGLSKSVAVSSDLAHALHPNYPDKHDPTNKPILGKGPVIKYSAKQKYITTAYSAAVFAGCCESAGVPLQKFANRSDVVGGGTIAHFLAQNLDIDVVDMGSPILGMHSVRELAAVKDVDFTYRAFKEFYSYKRI